MKPFAFGALALRIRNIIGVTRGASVSDGPSFMELRYPPGRRSRRASKQGKPQRAQGSSESIIASLEAAQCGPARIQDVRRESVGGGRGIAGRDLLHDVFEFHGALVEPAGDRDSHSSQQTYPCQ
jgi:hypothetical protein